MPPSLGGVGIGVSDMSRSVHFYTQVLPVGLKPTQTFDVAAFTETVLAIPRNASKKSTGSQIILMQYKNAAPPRNQQGKFIFYVDDVHECMRKCKEYGSEVYLEVGAAEDKWAKEIGMVRDPDGFIVEFIPTSVLRKSEGWGKKVESKI